MTSVFADDHNRSGDRYPHFREAVATRFGSVVGSGIPLFKTDADNLFDLFLSSLPEDARQHYTCHACRHFVNRFGGLVTISESGETTSIMWDDSTVPEFFRQPVAELKKAVLRAKVDGVFLSERATLGQPVTGEWEHLFAELPRTMVHRDRLKTADQVVAERLEEYRMLCTALEDYPANVVNQALTLINSDALYRNDKVKGVAVWFKGLRDALDGTKDSRRKANIRWLAVATAPAGFAHLRGGMFGTLLDDIKEGKSVPEIVRSFKEKMDPLQYMRPQAAPSQGNIQQAEKIVEKLGITASLRRRFATFEEITHFLWQDRSAARNAGGQPGGGVFGHLTPKGAQAAKTNTMNLPGTTMTWDKFRKTVLPTVETMEALVDSPSRFMALVTAADPEAPNILRWGNTFSWYYRRHMSYSSWNMTPGVYVKVKGITETPNLWGDNPVTHAGQQIFFLLEGCRDVTNSPGGGLFPENLRADLHEVRSTLEAYSNTAKLEGAENATACGAGYSKDGDWGITLKVTADNATRLIKIDRWD